MLHKPNNQLGQVFHMLQLSHSILFLKEIKIRIKDTYNWWWSYAYDWWSMCDFNKGPCGEYIGIHISFYIQSCFNFFIIKKLSNKFVSIKINYRIVVTQFVTQLSKNPSPTTQTQLLVMEIRARFLLLLTQMTNNRYWYININSVCFDVKNVTSNSATINHFYKLIHFLSDQDL